MRIYVFGDTSTILIRTNKDQTYTAVIWGNKSFEPSIAAGLTEDQLSSLLDTYTVNHGNLKSHTFLY